MISIFSIASIYSYWAEVIIRSLSPMASLPGYLWEPEQSWQHSWGPSGDPPHTHTQGCNITASSPHTHTQTQSPTWAGISSKPWLLSSRGGSRPPTLLSLLSSCPCVRAMQVRNPDDGWRFDRTNQIKGSDNKRGCWEKTRHGRMIGVRMMRSNSSSSSWSRSPLPPPPPAEAGVSFMRWQ